jgi:hypothetical protein
MKVLDVIVTGLLLIGALNWGLIGFLDSTLSPRSSVKRRLSAGSSMLSLV